jgi:large subunit ribosomal protein L15
MPLQRRVPKRGFTNPFRKEYCVVNVGDLSRFVGVTDVSVLELISSGLVKKQKDGVKLLADGVISQPLTIRVHKASAAAISKVEAAGGRVELIPS